MGFLVSTNQLLGFSMPELCGQIQNYENQSAGIDKQDAPSDSSTVGFQASVDYRVIFMAQLGEPGISMVIYDRLSMDMVIYDVRMRGEPSIFHGLVRHKG